MMNKRLIEFKKWMLDVGLRQSDIARKAGVTPMTIHLVMKGWAKSRRIEGILRELGCPEELLQNQAS